MMLARSQRAAGCLFSVVRSRCLHSCSKALAGHSKWANIKHTKARNDAERTKIYNKISAQITVAVKLGGSTDPNTNIRLATAIELANKNNVTKRVIENAIKKGSGASSGAGEGAEQYTYEGIGPFGVAFVIEALTDNKNRTVGLIRSTFNKFNGNMSPTLYFFDRKGYVVIEPKEGQSSDFDNVMETVLDIEGVEDLEQVENDGEESPETTTTGENPQPLFEVITEPTQTSKIAETLKDLNYYIREMGIEYVPKDETAMTPITDPESIAKFDKFMSQLEDIEDVTQIYSNIKN